MNIIKKALEDLIPYARNSRTHSDAQVAQIAASIREFGFMNPVLVDGENNIIAGHGRVLAARKLGLETVPCVLHEHLTESQRRAYILADNKLALNAGWDEEMLRLELVELGGCGFDLELTGFGLDELGAIDLGGSSSEGLSDPDDIPEVPEGEAVTVPGDVWVLGRHRLMCGDSTSVDAIERLMRGKVPDLVFADPPYGIDVVKGNQVEGGGVTKFGKVGGGEIAPSSEYRKIAGDETTETAKAFYHACVALGYENILLWGGNYFTDFLPPSRCWVVWDKAMTGNFSEAEMAWTSFTTGGIRLFKFLWNGLARSGSKKDELKKRVHPTQKPVGMFVDVFERLDGYKVIFDGFLGSGSTLIACEKAGRSCYGMELEPWYCDVIIKRWEEFTGEKAILEESEVTIHAQTAACSD